MLAAIGTSDHASTYLFLYKDNIKCTSVVKKEDFYKANFKEIN